jgi:hypothetical protein
MSLACGGRVSQTPGGVIVCSHPLFKAAVWPEKSWGAVARRTGGWQRTHDHMPPGSSIIRTFRIWTGSRCR